MKTKKIKVLAPANDLKKLANSMACCKPGAPTPFTAPEE